MVNACADPDFFVRLGGGGGSKPNGEKTALIFSCLFLCFLVRNFPGMRGGGPTIYGGGGVQMLISIEFDRLWIYQGWGSGPPVPHSLDPHMHDI